MSKELIKFGEWFFTFQVLIYSKEAGEMLLSVILSAVERECAIAKFLIRTVIVIKSGEIKILICYLHMIIIKKVKLFFY